MRRQREHSKHSDFFRVVVEYLYNGLIIRFAEALPYGTDTIGKITPKIFSVGFPSNLHAIPSRPQTNRTQDTLQ
ncbi:MAG: hypothetical protein LDLANPLL_02830 [Turneriella sp.]|nr:hypothetical protein [Turneriella sp.]